MRNKSRFSLALLLPFVLIGCGGGGGSDSSPPLNSAPPPPVTPSPTVPSASAGEFRQSANTGRYFGFDFGTFYQNEYNFGASSCRDSFNDYYFETDNLYVFGPQSLPESDFRTVAGWIESQLSTAASLVGSSNFESIVEKRNDIAPEVNGMLYDAFFQQQLSTVTYPVAYDEFVGWDIDQQMNWFAKYFRDANRAEQNTIIEEVGDFFGFSWTEESDYRLGQKLLVCLNQNSSANEYAHAGRYGISIAAPSVQSRNDAEQIVVHELIHSIQLMSFDSFHSPETLPRWFFEGQAVFLSGQTIANRNDASDYQTPTFISYFDEGSVNVGEIYQHYGLAYSYLHNANGVNKMMELLENIDASDFNFQGSFATDENMSAVNYNFNDGFNSHRLEFIQAFDMTGLVDANGQTLTLERFKRDYTSLLR